MTPGAHRRAGPCPRRRAGAVGGADPGEHGRPLPPMLRHHPNRGGSKSPPLPVNGNQIMHMRPGRRASPPSWTAQLAEDRFVFSITD